MDNISKRSRRWKGRKWLVMMMSMIVMCLAPAYGACSDCEDPNPDYDPDNPYESDPECIPKADGTVIVDCLSKEEEQIGGGYCISSLTVPPWTETSLGPGFGSLPVMYLEFWKRERDITYITDGYENICCVTESLICENGVEKIVNDWPGTFVRKDIVSQTPTTTHQEEYFTRFYYGDILCPPWHTDRPEPSPDPTNPQPCDYTPGSPCGSCP